ncbi:MAG: hypothetical protein EOP10_22930 [Proteobacteria bacterium]|nr:MAG: hypothetical protein EOP10_22930 [Pseudomonadota bacterium]
MLDPSSRGLANGWDSEYRRKLAPCLDGDFQYRGAHASDLTFMRDYTYDQILNETGAGVYGKASLFGLVSAKVQGNMAIAMAATEDSTSFIYNFSLLGKSAVLSGRRFNTNGSYAYNKNDLLFFRELCGDQFVEQVKLGGQLYLGVKYTFASKETKETISVKITLSAFWGLIKKSKTWTKEFRDIMKDVRISIEAFQIGGDPSKLQALKKQIYQGSCAGDEPELCADAIDRLLEYGSKDFAQQLDDMRLSDDPNLGPAIIDVVLEDYRSLKIYDPQSKKSVQVNVMASTTPESELAKALDGLERLKVSLKISENRIKILKEFKLSETDQTTVNTASTHINDTLSAIETVLSTTCARAKTDSSFLKNCLEKTRVLENLGKAANVPVSLSSREPEGN